MSLKVVNPAEAESRLHRDKTLRRIQFDDDSVAKMDKSNLPTAVRGVQQLVTAGPSKELRIVARVVAGWYGVFVLALSLTNVMRAPNSYEMFIVMHCCVGMFMTIAWTCFYGMVTVWRIAVALCLVAATGLLGVLLTWGQNWNLRDGSAMVYMPTFIALVGLIPIWAMRRFWGWRILHIEDASHSFSRRFGIRDTMMWTAFLAIVFTATRFVLGIVIDDAQRLASIIIATVAIPSIIAIVFLALVSRLSVYWMLAVVPVLALGSGLSFSIFAIYSQGQPSSIIDQVFLPSFVWFSAAGFLLTFIVWDLRGRGLIFAFGMEPNVASFERLKSDYETSLRKRLLRTRRLRRISGRFLKGRIQRLDSLANRASAIEFKAADADEASSK